MIRARHLGPLNNLRGTIEQRFLVNYRIDPDRVSAILPPPFTPELVDGYAIGGICIIQLKIGPRWLPRPLGFRSHNGAHRIAVTLPDGSSAVYVPQRHSNSRLNTVLGGRLFPGVHRKADITPIVSGDRIGVELVSRDGLTDVAVVGTPTDALPESSVFESVDHVSRFFEQGSLGYSDTRRSHRYDGMELRTKNWSVTPLAVDRVSSTFFDDQSIFPADSAMLDNALIMRNIDHTWHRHPTLTTDATDLAPTEPLQSV
jgi:hypothetical protein